MAFSARELVLILRAQNQASGALRRVASDLRNMGRVRDLQLRQQQIAIGQQNILRQRTRALRELQSLEAGSRAIGIERTRLNNMRIEEDRLFKLAQAEQRLAQSRRIGKVAQIKAAHAARQAGFRYASLGDSLRHVEARAVNNQKRIGELGQELRVLSSRSQILARQLLDVNTAIRQAKWEKLGFAGRALSHVGRVAQLAGLGLGAGIGYAANAAADFSRQVTLVATQTGRVGTGFETVAANANVLREALLRVMGDSMAPTQELTQATYDLFSSVDSAGASFLRLTDGVKLLKLTNQAAIAGQTDLTVATEAAIRTMNTFNVPIDKMPKAFARMFAAVRFGEMTFGEFANSLQTTAPAARAAGQSFDTLAGTMAFLTRRLGVAKAQVGFARLTEIFARKKFIEGLEKFNVDITDANGQLLQMPQIIDKLVSRFPKLARGGTFLQQFIRELSGTEGTIQARRAFVFLAQQADGYGEMVRRVTGDNTEFDRSLRAMSETSGVQWAQMLNRLRSLFLRLGDAAIPTIMKILSPIEDLVTWFEKLDKGTREQIGSWIAWSAAILLVGGTLASIVGGLTFIIASLARLGVAFPVVTIAVGALYVAIKLLSGEFSSLGDAAADAIAWTTKSATNFTIAAAIITAASFRLRRAAVTAGTAMTASGLPALLGFGGTRGRTATRGMAGVRLIQQTARSSGLMAGGFKTAAVAAALLPGPLKIAAVAMAGIAGLSFLLQRRQQAAAEAAERMAKAQAEFRKQLAVGPRAAQQFGGISTGVGGLRDTALGLRETNAQIKIAKESMKGLAGAERELAAVGLERLFDQRRDLLIDLTKHTAMVAGAANAYNTALQTQNQFHEQTRNRLGQITRLEHERRVLQRQLASSRLTDPAGAQQLQARIAAIGRAMRALKAEQEGFQRASAKTAQILETNFNKVLTSLQDAQLLPKRIPDQAVQNIKDFAKQIGRMPSLKQMKMFIKAELDPKSLRNLPAIIQNFIRRQRHKIKIATEIDKAQLTGIGARARKEIAGEQIPIKTQANVKGIEVQIANLRQAIQGKPIKLAITTTQSGRQVGVDFATGVMAGMNSINPTLHVRIFQTTIINEHRKQSGSQSPSKLFAEKVGKPFAQGVLLGMLKEIAGVNGKKMTKETVDELIKAYRDALKTGTQKLLDTFRDFRQNLQDQFFGDLGEISQLRLDWGVALNIGELTKDLNTSTAKLRTFAKNLKVLRKQNVPGALLIQLSQMGEEGSAIIGALANATGGDLKAYVKAWKQSQKLLNQVAKDQTKIQVKEWRKLGKAMAFGIIQGIRDEEPKLARFFRNMFKNLFNTAQSANQSHSPSRLYMKEGMNIVKGLEQGLATGMGLTVPRPGVHLARPAIAGNQQNITVNAMHSEDLNTTLRRAAFRMKHRRT